jgi:EAL domain-containing protein (putative c-di-GMP-specific phosphodiesterase class I)
VDGLGQPDGQPSIVRGIVDLGHALQLETVAEGIESAHQLDQLRRLGCEYGQGFHFSRPLDPADVEVLLRSGGRLAGPAEPEVTEPPAAVA